MIASPYSLPARVEAGAYGGRGRTCQAGDGLQGLLNLTFRIINADISKI